MSSGWTGLALVPPISLILASHAAVNEIYSYFWTTRAALKHLPDGGAIINTGSVNGLRGNRSLIDYAATKAP